jgi:hypothetical protein
LIRKNPLLVLLFLAGLIQYSPVLAGDVSLKNDFTFYGDNTEFFEPFRNGETILGTQGKSYFEVGLGPKAFLLAGVYADYRDIFDPTVAVKPVLSFQFRDQGTRLVLGTLETHDRHGYLEPLEVTTLEFTRPVEYGFQWLENDETFHVDLFLSWHQLNTPSEPETFDYGGVLQGWQNNPLSVEFQMHGFHEGGQIYFVAIRNNWNYALGFRLKGDLGSLGEGRMAVFGLLSGDLNSGVLSDIRYGGGGYLKASLRPGSGLELFGIGWRGRDFISEEGDANYASYSDYQNFYQADRFYFELGARKEFPMEGGSVFTAELRSHWIEQYWAYSYRMAVTAPFDLFLFSTGQGAKKNHDDPDS